MKNENNKWKGPDYESINLKMKSGNKDIRKMAQKHYNEGKKHYRANRRFEALTSFQKVLEYDPDFIKTHKKLVKMYLEVNDRHSAMVQYKEIVRLDRKNKEALNFLFDYYLEKERPIDAADILKIKCELVKNKKNKREMMMQAGDLYFLGGEIEKAKQEYLSLLREDEYNPEIIKKLQNIYHRLEDHGRWKICEQILILNKSIIPKKSTKTIEIFRAPGPVTSEVYKRISHPGGLTFKKFFGWLAPVFKIMEANTPPDILRLSESVDQDSRNYQLFKECCHYLSMEIPPLRHYNGPAEFKFIVDPLEGKGEYALLYNDQFLAELSDVEKVFLFSNYLSIIKSEFVPLLYLSVSDIARIIFEIATMILSFLTVFKSIPLGKASNVVKKSSKASSFLSYLQKMQMKLISFKLIGKSTEEMELMMKKSADMLPEKVEGKGAVSYKSLLNIKLLESSLRGFYHTADRVSFYLTRDLVESTRALVHLLSGEDAIERIRKFGLQPYISETKNKALKQRLGDLYFFVLESGMEG
ncbi:MAG: hypothetical protein K8T10_11325 [Candidatus Eremiobacteraeota bacterium]|nr:hypothetical protein [Candidatus Eremiobacteraeota bacterium]